MAHSFSGLDASVRVCGGGGGGGGGHIEDASGVLCSPVTNRMLVFDGSLLHGVMPARPSAPASDVGPDGMWNGTDANEPEVRFRSRMPRTTLMLGFWGAAVDRSPCAFQRPRPPMKSPGKQKKKKKKKNKAAAMTTAADDENNNESGSPLFLDSLLGPNMTMPHSSLEKCWLREFYGADDKAFERAHAALLAAPAADEYCENGGAAVRAAPLEFVPKVWTRIPTDDC